VKIFLVLVSLSGVRQGAHGTWVTNWPVVLAPDDDEYRAFGVIIIVKGNRSIWRKHNSVPFCQP
jgi:hypothetical protein